LGEAERAYACARQKQNAGRRMEWRKRGMPVAVVVDSSPLAFPFYRSIWQVQLALSLKFSTAQWDGHTGIIISTLKII